MTKSSNAIGVLNTTPISVQNPSKSSSFNQQAVDEQTALEEDLDDNREQISKSQSIELPQVTRAVISSIAIKDIGIESSIRDTDNPEDTGNTNNADSFDEADNKTIRNIINNDCVRIKGVNSDYTFDVNTGQILENKNADPLYLKIFICPNQMPSRIEHPHKGDWCEGTDADCPDAQKTGHAMICLHQQEGIALVTANGITAQGSFQVQPQGKKTAFRVTDDRVTATVPFVVQPEGKEPVLQITEMARSLTTPVIIHTNTQKRVLEISDTSCTITAPIVLRNQTEHGLQISVSDQEIILKTPSGAVIQLKENDIEITPGTAGKVKINGNLEVTGEITVAGKQWAV